MNRRERFQKTEQVDVPLASFKTVLDLVREHNARTSGGALIGKKLAQMLLNKTRGEEEQKTPQELEEEDAIAAHSSSLMLASGHEETLRSTGLSIETGRARRSTSDSSAGAIVAVTDPELFLSYISSPRMHAARESEPREFESAVLLMEQFLRKQVASMEFGSLSSSDKRALSSLPQIARALGHLAPGPDAEALAAYARMSTSEKKLEQYLAVEDAGLWLAPRKGFGPADWVIDITPEHLQEKWSEALATLREQEALGRDGVGAELKDHLLTCVSAAAARLSETTWSAEIKEKMSTILKSASAQLVGTRRLN